CSFSSYVPATPRISTLSLHDALPIFTGDGVSQDMERGAELLRRAAEVGYAPAQNSLGLSYDFGEGVSQDYVEAARWYRAAAEQRSEEHTSELQSRENLVCRLLLEKKK